jgi:hypothetical protein
LADQPASKLVIHDILGWHCEVANIFIRHKQIQIVPKKENLLNGDGQQFHQYQQNKHLSPQISEN